MSFIAGILTVLLVVNCVLLILLVLVQLPKKDAGAGMAFGGGAADALFGAGSGNVLTKITKWATGIFFAMALILGVVDESAHRSNTPAFEQAVQQNTIADAGWRAARHAAAGRADDNQQFIFLARNPGRQRACNAAADK